MTTVTEVAAHAGVSPMTVSRVLSGNPHVREDTRARVEASIRALRYHRNENARSLRQRVRAAVVGVIVTNLANPYYADVLEGIEAATAGTGRRLLIGASHEDPGLEAELVDDFLGRQVEGLIVVPSDTAPAHLGRLGSVPLVLASRAVAGLDVDAVLVDDVAGAVRATDLLIDEGHTRIGFLGNATSMFTMQRRFAGFRSALARRGVALDPAIVRSGRDDIRSAERAMTEIMSAADPPTAVFTTNNRNTIGALRAFARRADAGPLRLSGFDDFELSDLVEGRLTLVDHDPHALGQAAATLLLDRLAEPARAPRTLELPTTLLTRGRPQGRAVG